jgi:glycosyltransferase involved in cell wall biosynthesis
MRILMVSDYAREVGGAEKYFFSLADLLGKHGHEVEVFGKRDEPGKAVIASRIYNPLWARRIARAINEFKPDIVHAHHVSFVLSPAVLRAAKKRDVAVVMTVHDFHLVCPRTWFVRAGGRACSDGFGMQCLLSGCALRPYYLYVMAKLLLHRRMIRANVDRVIAPSRMLADWLERNLHMQNVQVLPNFIPNCHMSLSPLRESRTILFLGRLVPEKGLEVLIKAMPVILEKIPEARLVVVGSGEQEEYLRRLCRELGVSTSVEFTGWLSGD